MQVLRLTFAHGGHDGDRVLYFSATFRRRCTNADALFLVRVRYDPLGPEGPTKFTLRTCAVVNSQTRLDAFTVEMRRDEQPPASDGVMQVEVLEESRDTLVRWGEVCGFVSEIESEAGGVTQQLRFRKRAADRTKPTRPRPARRAQRPKERPLKKIKSLEYNSA